MLKHKKKSAINSDHLTQKTGEKFAAQILHKNLLHLYYCAIT